MAAYAPIVIQKTDLIQSDEGPPMRDTIVRSLAAAVIGVSFSMASQVRAETVTLSCTNNRGGSPTIIVIDTSAQTVHWGLGETVPASVNQSRITFTMHQSAMTSYFVSLD